MTISKPALLGAIRGGCCGFLVLAAAWGPAAQAGLPEPGDQSDPVPADEAKDRRGPKLYGYTQAYFRHAVATGEDPDVDNENFRIQRVRIGIKGEVQPKVSYVVEIDPRSPAIEGVLRDAYIALEHIPRHELRIGQQKTQFGYENNVSSSKLFAVNRTEISEGPARGRTLRDIGVGLIGNVKLGGGWRFEDAITVVNGAGANAQEDDTPTKNIWGRLGMRYKNDDSNLVTRFGASGGHGDFIDPDDPTDPTRDLLIKFESYGVDVQVDHRLFFVSAEVVMGIQHITNVDPANPDGPIDEIDDPMGYYVNLVGKIPSLHAGPILRYDTLGDEFARLTLGAYWGEAAAPLRLMLSYELRQLIDEVRADDKAYVWLQVRF